LKIIDPLLRNDREISKYTRTVSRQQLGKQVPAATNRRATIEVLLETMFSTRSVPKVYQWDKFRASQLLIIGHFLLY
jgi:hypothetical protein